MNPKKLEEMPFQSKQFHYGLGHLIPWVLHRRNMIGRFPSGREGSPLPVEGLKFLQRDPHISSIESPRIIQTDHLRNKLQTDSKSLPSTLTCPSRQEFNTFLIHFALWPLRVLMNPSTLPLHRIHQTIGSYLKHSPVARSKCLWPIMIITCNGLKRHDASGVNRGGNLTSHM